MLKRLLLGTAIAGFAGAAQADVTAREVWDAWTSSLGDGEAELSTGSVDEGVGNADDNRLRAEFSGRGWQLRPDH